MESSADSEEPLYATTATEITAQDEFDKDTARIVTQGGKELDQRVEEDGSIRVWPLGRGKRKIKVKQVRATVYECQRGIGACQLTLVPPHGSSSASNRGFHISTDSTQRRIKMSFGDFILSVSARRVAFALLSMPLTLIRGLQSGSCCSSG
jgi:hypothetical protein